MIQELERLKTKVEQINAKEEYAQDGMRWCEHYGPEMEYITTCRSSVDLKKLIKDFLE